MTLSIRVHDQMIVRDKLHTNRRWFNGIKFFFTVKLLPPTK